MTSSSLRQVLLACVLSTTACLGTASHSTSAVDVDRKDQPTPRDSRVNRYWDEETGFGISRPATWHFLSPGVERSRRKNISYGNAAFDEQVRNDPELLVVIVKDPHARRSCTPTVKVQLLSATRGMSSRDVALREVEEMRQSVPTFELRSDLEEGMVARHVATHYDALIKYRAVKRDFTCDVLTRVWILPRDDDMFAIGMSALPNDQESWDSEFVDILASISLRD